MSIRWESEKSCHKTDDYYKGIDKFGKIVARVRNIYVPDEYLLLDEHYNHLGTYESADAARKAFERWYL